MGTPNKPKPWEAALREYVAENPDAVKRVLAALFAKGEEGDVGAARELRVGLDGKETPNLSLSVEGDAEVITEVRWTVVENTGPQILPSLPTPNG